MDIDDGLEISAVLERGNPKDVIVTRPGEKIIDNKNFIVGTGSIRRRIFMQKMYQNVSFSDIRGNVDTRIKKLLDGNYDAIILAAAGLERLGIKEGKISFFTLDIDRFLPAPCQGIIAVESRKSDKNIFRYISSINDTDTFYVFETEKYILKLMGGNCDIPIGAYAIISENKIYLKISDTAEYFASDCAPIDERFMLAEKLVKEI